jgi:anti-sigma factor RsiW
MANNSEHSDKILKTFSNIRCLNRDQLPRYLDGRLTDVEKHLVEQHLVDCDLCYDALQVLAQPKHREKYQPLSVSIQQYIRNSIRQVSQVQKAERYQRKEQKKESLLIYFWVVAGIALAAGVIYLVQQDNKFKSTTPKPIASNAMPTIQAANRQEVDQPVGGPPAHPPKDTVAAVAPAVATPAPTAVPVPVVKKDSVVAAPKPKPVVKPDTVARKPAPAPVEEKKAAPVEKEKEKEAPVVAKKEEPKPAPKEKEKEKDKDDDDKKPSAPATSGTDEFLYKAAMVYHQQGDLNEAISRYKHLSTSNSRYGELARYQLAVCYRSKGQTGKARRMFKEVVNMGGSMKDKAQAALDNL